MTCPSKTHQRGGGTLVECAIVYSLTLLLTLGLVIGSLGVFRYQQVASLAREAARWASVHGEESSRTTGKPAATPEDIYQKAILPKAVALDPSRLSYSVTWNPDKRQGAKVTVTLNYEWRPEAFLGAVTLSSTSVAVVAY